MARCRLTPGRTGLTHQSYAFWFGDCDGQDLSWPIIPTGCACTLKIVRLAAHVYLYCVESLEGLRAEPQWNLSRILNILSTVGIVNGLRLPAVAIIASSAGRSHLRPSGIALRFSERRLRSFHPFPALIRPALMTFIRSFVDHLFLSGIIPAPVRRRI